MGMVHSQHTGPSASALLGLAIFVWALKVLVGKWAVAKRVAREVGICPPRGALTLLNPFRTISIVMGPIYPFRGQIGWYFAEFSLYRKYGSTCLVSTTFWDALPTYWLADADAIKAVTSDRCTFSKDVAAYDTLNIYGHNIIGTEGTEWKRHRAVAKTAFNEANNAFVWCEATRVVNEWFAEIDDASLNIPGKQPITQIDLLRDLTRATLLIIASAGFGRRSTWQEDASSTPPTGHGVPLSQAVTSAIGKLFHRILTPRPIWNAVTERGVYVPVLGPMLLEAKGAFDDLKVHMTDVVSQARDDIATGRSKRREDAMAGTNRDGTRDAALLSNLAEANMSFEKEDAGNRSLTDDELMSNMFIFFLAGHETSAHALCFAFAYLAVHPECQQKVFEEGLKVFPKGVPAVAPTSAYKTNVPQLEYTSAVLHETLRLRPPVVRLGKVVQRDSVIKSKRFTTLPEGTIKVTEEVNLPVREGGLCVIDIMGLHMNPIHWGDDVDKFRPERFIDTDTYKWPRDAFLAFSGGPRSCIGQRFAITESICIIASIVRQYEVLLPEGVLGLGLEEQKRILTGWTSGVTIIPTHARVRFKKRAEYPVPKRRKTAP